jgi:predicted glycogen debranching enzyme
MKPHAEWIETDGLGGFAMGRADGVRTRRYHSLLTVATTPPTGRVTLVNGVDAVVGTAEGACAISSQRYATDVMHPDGASRVVAFTTDPWPTWTYELPGGQRVVHELVMRHGAPLVVMSWRLAGAVSPVRDGAPAARLVVRPFLSVRDTHGEARANDAFRFGAAVGGQRIDWHPYDGLPGITAVTNGEYLPDATWYRNFQYDEERARGLGFTEDLAAPGSITFNLGAERAVLAFATEGPGTSELVESWALRLWESVSSAERARRARFRSPLHRAADAYLVRRGAGRTIVAGYPWFSDWGRDTFIALRGLCIAGDRLEDARDILLEWAGHVSEGMLPNFFPEGGNAEYNSVDASLWYVVAVHDFLRAAEPRGMVSAAQLATLAHAVEAIVSGYAHGTRFGIRADGTGLLAAGVSGVQLTWMDARIGDWVVTPRIGKPVEIQALWINALRVAARWRPRWNELADYAEGSFDERFWNAGAGCLHDVVDVDHVAGTVDATVRPNQLLAVGGLPWPLLAGERARSVVEAVERVLWTPAGPRSIAPDDAAYVPHYGGDMRTRDAAYHQGTVWPWLAGAFVEAWVRVRGGTPEARDAARERFLEPLVAHYAATSPGHLAEIADADAPHAPNGCPFQAWSVGEALRLAEDVLRPTTSLAPSARRRRVAQPAGI